MICVFVGVLLVTGDIEISVTREQIDIAGSYWSDYTVEVGDILSVSYTEDLETGKRTGGFGSFKLAEGNFKTVNLAPISCMHIQSVTVMLSWKRQTRWL